MFDANSHLQSFHDDRVTLSDAMKDVMRQRRAANQERLVKGLEEAGHPLPVRHVKQGSYAMHTMVQSEVETSDIDDGAVFTGSDLTGPRGASLAPLDAKQRVRDAIASQGADFKTPPAVKNNCVRVFYADGFTIDIPVYREVADGNDTRYELASTTWKKSDPEAVTAWFNGQVIAKSPDADNGRQMRRIVRFLKAWARSRASWNMPSGFIFSVLVYEVYPTRDATLLDRDDEALVRALEAMALRLTANRVVRHPVLDENITKTESDACMIELHERVVAAIEALHILRKASCSEIDALKAWRDFFNTDHFDARLAELEREKEEAKAALAKAAAPAIIGLARDGKVPEREVIKRGGEGRYA